MEVPKDKAAAVSDTPRAEAVLIEAERKSFSRLLIHPLMMQDHLPRSYVESIHRLQFHCRNRQETTDPTL